MQTTDWEDALARAVTDHSFRARFLGDPADALMDYGLHGAEAGKLEAALAGGVGRTLEQLVARIMQVFASEATLETVRRL